MKLFGRQDLRLLENIASAPSDRVRGEWHHYACPFCFDQSKHLGINKVNGAVKCLRCGYKNSMNASYAKYGHPSDPIPASRHGVSGGGLTFSTACQNSFDEQVRSYMVDRGLGTESLGWGYGRGDLLGRVVIPVRGISGDIVYYQSRSATYGHSWAYRSPDATLCKRLDFWDVPSGCATVSQSVLVLVEGPMDALKVRSAGFWAAPLFGMSVPSPLYGDDIIAAIHKLGTRKILVWLDAEPIAERQSDQLERWLRSKLLGENMDVIQSVYWPVLNGQDPAELGIANIANTLVEYI